MARLPTLGPSVPEVRARRVPELATRAAAARITGRQLQAIRDRILTRDRGLCHCARCQASGALTPAAEVDHSIPLWAGGQETDGNRQAIGADCHRAKSRAEAAMRAAGHAPTHPADWVDWARG